MLVSPAAMTIRCSGNSRRVILFVQNRIHNWHTTTRRCTHTVGIEELPRYCEVLDQFTPRSYQFQNIALCKQRGKDQPVILTDEWPNFTCTAVFQPWTSNICFPTRNQRTSRLMLLSSHEEKFAAFLHDSKLLQEGAMIAAIDSLTNRHLDNVAKVIFPEWQETSHYSYKLSYISASKIKDMPSKLSSNDFFFDKLKPEHADFIGKYWTDKSNSDFNVIKKYLKHVITLYGISTGIFTKSNPSHPVAWGLYGDIGHAIGLYTLPEYRRKSFAVVLSARLFTHILREGIIPLIEQHSYSVVSGKFGQTEKYFVDTSYLDG